MATSSALHQVRRDQRADRRAQWPALWTTLGLAALCLYAWPAAAQRSPGPAKEGGKRTTSPAGKQGKPPPQEDLAQLMARRITRATGLPAAIDELTYSVFSSTFEGRGVRVGPKARPRLAIAKFLVELSLFAKGQGTHVVRVDVSRPRIRLAQGWLRHLYRFGVRKHTTVEKGQLRGGRVWIDLGGTTLEVRQLAIDVSQLRAPVTPAGKAPALSGGLRLRVADVRVGARSVGRLDLRGTLDKGQLQLQRVQLAGRWGKVTLSGSLGLGDNKRGPGPVVLAGELELASPTARGKVELRGATLERLTVTGRLNGAGLPARGGLSGAPGLDLRLGVGRKRLKGTLRRWRVR